MIYLIKFVYMTFLLPPGIFIILFLFCTFMLFKSKKQKRYKRVLLGVVVAFYFASTSFLSDLAMHSLEYKYTPPSNIKGDVIILLGGGATLDTPNLGFKGHLSGYAANRLITAVELQKKLKIPVVVSGGKVYKNTGTEADIAKRIFNGLGIEDKNIIVEDKSLNTKQNAQYVAEIMSEKGYKKPILITSAFHMPRSVEVFKKAGIDVLPVPTDYKTNEKLSFSLWDFIPSAYALHNLQLSIKEQLGRAVER